MIKPLSVVYGEYGLNTGFRTRIEMMKSLLTYTTGTIGDWLTFEREINRKIVQIEGFNSIIRLPRTRSVSNLFKNYSSIMWGKTPQEIGSSYDLVLAHSFNSIFAANALKKRFNVPLLLDIHGLWLEEVISWSQKKSGIKESLLKVIEQAMFFSADGVIFASNVLKDVMIGRYPFLNKKPNAVIHCVSDFEVFKFNSEARQRLRAEWNWENNIVIVHSGINAPWVDARGIGNFVKICCENFSEVRFLFLSNDPSSWHEIFKGFGEESKIKIMSVQHRDMPLYLSSADIGFIARTISPINRVASPTKISEYLTVGLPVIMTKGIGDYDSWVSQFNLGATVSDLSDLTGEGAAQILKKVLAIDRNYVSCWANNNLSIFNYVEVFRDIIKKVEF